MPRDIKGPGQYTMDSLCEKEEEEEGMYAWTMKEEGLQH